MYLNLFIKSIKVEVRKEIITEEKTSEVRKIKNFEVATDRTKTTKILEDYEGKTVYKLSSVKEETKMTTPKGESKYLHLLLSTEEEEEDGQ